MLTQPSLDKSLQYNLRSVDKSIQYNLRSVTLSEPVNLSHGYSLISFLHYPKHITLLFDMHTNVYRICSFITMITLITYYTYFIVLLQGYIYT
jgi:hypothetical protein